jgi:glutamate-1-semialdehyde 2,1-aminomutase
MGIKLIESKQLFDRATRIIPGGVNSPVRAFKHVGGTPIFLEHASGSRLTDADGNSYVDFCQSWGPLILGHAHPSVVEAVIEAAKDGLSYGACHRREVELAELILSGFKKFQRVRVMSSGTEAVMTALRLARGVTGRELLMKFEGGYHGHFDSMLVKAGSGLATFGIASSAGIPEDIARATLVAPLDDEEAVESQFKKHGDRIAAIIIEPLPANNGLLVQRKGFLEFLRKITQKYGTMLIFDEVISGFRLRFGGYGQAAGIEPDLFTLGKVVGGGMPIGAVVGRADTMDALSPLGAVYQAGTLSGNPVSLAAGIATLKFLKKEPVYEKLELLGRRFEEFLEKSDLSYARTQRMGSIVWLYLDEGAFPRRHDTISEKAVERFKNIYWRVLEDGYYLPPSAYEVLFLSFAHSPEEVEALAASIVRNLHSVR